MSGCVMCDFFAVLMILCSLFLLGYYFLHIASCCYGELWGDIYEPVDGMQIIAVSCRWT